MSQEAYSAINTIKPPFTQAILDILRNAVGFPTMEKLAAIQEKYYLDDHTFITVTVDKPYVGILGLQTLGHNHMIIKHLAVTENYRQQGMARVLINYVIKTYGLSKLSAETDDEATDFYSKMGFIIEPYVLCHSHVKRYKCLWTKQDDL